MFGAIGRGGLIYYTLTEEMMNYARKYEFEKAAAIRDFIQELKSLEK